MGTSNFRNNGHGFEHIHVISTDEGDTFHGQDLIEHILPYAFNKLNGDLGSGETLEVYPNRNRKSNMIAEFIAETPTGGTVGMELSVKAGYYTGLQFILKTTVTYGNTQQEFPEVHGFEQQSFTDSLAEYEELNKPLASKITSELSWLYEKMLHKVEQRVKQLADHTLVCTGVMSNGVAVYKEINNDKE